jgi:hypothetical protein
MGVLEEARREYPRGSTGFEVSLIGSSYEETNKARVER